MPNLLFRNKLGWVRVYGA